MAEARDARLVALYDLPGHILRRAWQYRASVFQQAIGDLDITNAQFIAIAAINVRPGMEQRELSSVIFYDAATTGGIVKRLEKLGAVRRAPSGRSKRGQALYLTAAGLQLLSAAAPAIEQVSRNLLSPLDPDEQRTLLMLLSKMAGVANSYNPERT